MKKKSEIGKNVIKSILMDSNQILLTPSHIKLGWNHWLKDGETFKYFCNKFPISSMPNWKDLQIPWLQYYFPNILGDYCEE